MKVCKRCKASKTAAEFSKDKTRNDGLSNQCRECSSAYQMQYRIDNKEKHVACVQNSRARAQYGVTGDEYRTAMSTSSCCEICSSTDKLCYDHCHVTMAFRGVLCYNCNLALGKLGDNEEGLARALEYLRK